MNRNSLDGRASSVRGSSSNRGRDRDRRNSLRSSWSTSEASLVEAPPPTSNPWHRQTAVDIQAKRTSAATKIDPLPREVTPGKRRKPRNSVSGDQAQKPPVALTPPKHQDLKSSSKGPHLVLEKVVAETVFADTGSSDAARSETTDTEAEAIKSREKLWNRPFGADILVVTQSIIFHVHRTIVVPQSGWLRDNLPPPNATGSPVEMRIPFAEGAVGHCLRFMYTGRLEICNPNETHPLSIVHLPRCALAFCAAVSLQVNQMTEKIIQFVDETTKILRTASQGGLPIQHNDQAVGEAAAFVVHIHDALEITYGESQQALMKPMRLALAGVLDASIFWLVSYPLFVELTASAMWQRHSQAILDDQSEYRQLLGQYLFLQEGNVPPEEANGRAFERRWSGDTLENKAGAWGANTESFTS